METRTEGRSRFEPLALSPELSRTLPSWVYWDDHIFGREKECIFPRTWSFITHATQLQAVDSYATGWIDDQNVFLVRGTNGGVRGFFNACRNCACELLHGAGLAASITCPYCGTAYLANGAPRSTRADDSIEAVARSASCLVPIGVEELCGLVFANLDLHPTPLCEQAPHLGPSLTDFMPAIASLRKCYETIHDVQSNWKVMIDNSLECYHCEPCHPGFAQSVDMGRYRSVSNGIVTTHTSQRRQRSEKFGDIATDDSAANRFSYWYVWPVTEIDAVPGPRPRLSVFTRRSLAPDRFRLIGQYFRLPDDLPSEEDKAGLDNNVTLLEDVAICESVQRGLRSRGYTQGRFIVDAERSHNSEHSVHHFQRLVASALAL
jgi:carnitine monooxygenase subunit